MIQSCTSENTVGIPYILMSKASGSPLSLYWNPLCRREISRADQEYLVFQLGTIAKELSRFSFDRAGSLFEEGTIISIKTCLSRGLLLNSRCHIENLPRGPFTSEWDYHAAHLQAYKEHAKYLQLGHHCFFAPVPTRSDYSRDVDYAKASKTWSDFVTTHSKIDSSENRIDYILAGEMLGESMVELSNSYPGNSSQRSKPRFALQHPDLNVDNIFVDKDMYITCIIDWQFCTTVPLSVLSVAPNLPQPRRELDPSLTPLFQRGLGISAANSEDQGYEVFRGRLISLFSQILSFESTADFHLFEIIWGLLGNPVTCIPALFDSDQMKEHYRSLYYELKEEDQNETDITIKEAQYFGRDVEGLAIARKLTLVSEWSSRYHEPRLRKHCSPFIADKRLWNWVRDSLEI